MIFICNSPGVTDDSIPEPLPLESDFLITVSCVFHIYRYNCLSFNNISQPNRNIVLLTFITISSKCYYKLLESYYKLQQKPIKHYRKKLLKITASLLQTTTESSYQLQHLHYKLWQKLFQIYDNLQQVKFSKIIDGY